MSKLFEKVIALILVMVLTSANLLLLGEYTLAYALSDEELSTQDSKTNNKNVEFNVSFEGDTHIQTLDIGSDNAKLYMKIKFNSEGYLENGIVEFQNANFKLKDGITNENIQSIEGNKIILNKIKNGSDITIELPIQILKEENVAIDYFNKESLAKFTATYIDGEGNKKDITKEVSNKLAWKGDAELLLTAENTKYVPYIVGDEYGVLVQTKVNTSIKDAILPVKNTNIEVTAPTINNLKPTLVTVIANKTEATNGKNNGLDFNNTNYTYNQESGIVNINVSNLPDSISWKSGETDEYLVTYLFEGKEVYDFANTNGIDSTVAVKANVTLYNNEDLIKNQEVQVPVKYTESYKAITDFAVSAPESISKGFIYANYDTDKKVEQEYSYKYVATISSSKLVSTIQFIQKYDNFLTEDESKGATTVGGSNYAYNKRIEISQAIFNKILGEDGKITIKDSNGKELGVINKDTTLANGIYSIDISDKNNNNIIIETTAPITEGQLEFNIVKAFKGNIDYSKDQMKNFKKLEMELEGKTNTTTFTSKAQTLLKETETKVELEVSKKDLTTVVKNENVEIRVILDTSNEYNALFKNPTLKITLPENIKEFNLKSSNILLANGLKIKSSNVTQENGRYVINVELEGNQTEYAINAEYKGAIVVLNTDITLDTLAPTGINKVKLEYTNANDVATNAQGTLEQDVNYVAPVGVIAANEISNYKDNMPSVTSISGETKTVEIDTYSNKRTATIDGTVVNNYQNEIGNVVILGRIPAQGNKKIDADEELGSTFNMMLSTAIGVAGIDSSNYTIYYSDNQNATNDLQDANNGWSTEAKTSSKSYMIVFNNDFKMQEGSKFEFEYNVEIPENLEPNQKSYSMYKVYYDNNSEIGTMPESKVSPVMGVDTGKGPELEIELSSTADVVREGQYVKMKANVKNIGSTDVEGIKLTAQKPEYTTFLDYGVGNGYYELEGDSITLDVGNLKAGESKEVEYYIKIDDDTTMLTIDIEDQENLTPEEEAAIEKAESFPKEITNVVTATANGFEGQIKSNEYKMQIQDGSISMQTFSYITDGQVLKTGDTVIYCIELVNISDENTLNNTTVKMQLPQGMKYESGYVKDTWSSEEQVSDGISYDESTNMITINVGSLERMKVIELNAKVENLEGNFSVMPTATADGIEEQYSNILENKAEKPDLEISELTSSPRYVKETENVTYKFTVKNNGESTARGVKIVDELPEGLDFVEAKYTYANQEEKVTTLKNGKVEFTISVLEPGQTIEISIIAKANLLPDKNDKEVLNRVSVSAISFDEVQTNEVSNIIEYYEDAHNGNTGGGTSGNNRHKISGTAWIDSDMNGKRDTGEQRVSDIQVFLLNKTTGSIVKDPDSNEDKITTTSQSGSYQFNNLPNGEYLVVFVYDSSNYSLTEYKKSGVDESYNSDVIDVNITINGERRIAAITDTITINGDNARDVDIGLYTANRFDLRLDKTVSKITLATPTIGTQTYEYNHDLAKVELLGQNVGKSSAVIEYKIAVKNEGSVPGYVSKIVDYLPEKVSFNTELNPDWYLSDNGNIYNSSLANEVIKPGETKEVTLIVSLQITQDVLGSMYNDAEIYEAYNDQGLQDIDSTPANEAESEDDMSQATVVVSLVTGKIVMYTSISLVVIALIGFGIFEIKKHVLNGKNK